MQMKIFASTDALAVAAADEAATALRQAIEAKGRARLVAATGAAQFRFLEVLTGLPDIQWHNVELFHLDEYIGVADTHPASFCRFLRERLIEKTGIRAAHLLSGTGDPHETIRTVTEAIRSAPIDVAFIGIGENAHLAFNDPPADFETDESFLVVDLDEACRKQQLGEGWFASLADVPTKAISMAVKQMLKAAKIIAIVPDRRKADAVAHSFNEGISPMYPASILRTHVNTSLYLDDASASLLAPETVTLYVSARS